MNLRQLTELFEHINVNEITLTDQELWLLVKDVSDRVWVECTGILLRGIAADHQVNGNVINTLHGIRDWYREHDFLTDKQRYYLYHNIVENWPQIDFKTRNSLMLY